MYLQHWKYELTQDIETGRFCVRHLTIEKGRFGGGVVTRTIYESESYDDAVSFCRAHNIHFTERRG